MAKALLALACLVLARAPAWAVEETHGPVPESADAAGAHGDAAHGAEAGGVGLPQFDPSSFPSQVFWLAIAFAVMYFFFSRKTLPEIFSVIENRQERIQNDLDMANKLKDEAEKVQAIYEEDLENAQRLASEMYVEMEKSMKEKAEQQLKEFQKHSHDQIINLERNIGKAKQEVMSDMSDLAAEIASKAAEKIIGVETDIDQVRSVVESLHGAKAKAA